MILALCAATAPSSATGVPQIRSRVGHHLTGDVRAEGGELHTGLDGHSLCVLSHHLHLDQGWPAPSRRAPLRSGSALAPVLPRQPAEQAALGCLAPGLSGVAALGAPAAIAVPGSRLLAAARTWNVGNLPSPAIGHRPLTSPLTWTRCRRWPGQHRGRRPERAVRADRATGLSAPRRSGPTASGGTTCTDRWPAGRGR
jgi:hypothetical protein